MYKNYNTNQLILPLDTRILFGDKDLCAIIHDLVESIPESQYSKYYNSRGASSYHPKMMLKIILYSYTQSVFSGRRIEASLNDSIRMMWLSQEQKPSYRTINRFRVHPVMDDLLKNLYTNFRAQLTENNLIDEDAIFIDGTKIEANANKYSFVWKKTVLNNQSKAVTRARLIYEDLYENEIIQEIKNEMDEEFNIDDTPYVDEALTEKIEDLTHKMEQSDDSEERKSIRKERTSLKAGQKEIRAIFERNKKYEGQLKILGERNSYSKTDHDAVFMRMKDDHMRNGQLKAGYNIQIATNNQFVLAYDVFPNPTDTKTLIPFLNTYKALYHKFPQHIVADAGYGSESNYEILIDDLQVIPLIPFNMYVKEQSPGYRKDRFNTFNWKYHELEDAFICPQNHPLPFKDYSVRKNGDKEQVSKVYQCDMCQECPLKTQCISAQAAGNKKIFRNNNLEYFKEYTRQKLSDQETGNIYARRKIDVEPVFGYLKAILGFTRMSVRGTAKVKKEIGIALMAVNIRKMAAVGGQIICKNHKKTKKMLKSHFLRLFLLPRTIYVPDSLFGISF
ncbi:IS1182 family transposase [Macrococcus brunensis]|uniref:IS1182 family transposase n=1 Tax=Macrococcus brunensis TaxID=198483 RepID=UPI0030840273